MANGKKSKTNGQKRRGKNGGGNGNGKKKGGTRMTSNTQGLSMQVAQRNMRPLVERGVTLRGSDYLGQVTAKALLPTAVSRILGTFPITPSGYPGTRITQLADNWERYKFKTFRIRYVPAVPTTVACQFVLYIDTDPNDDPTIITDGDALIRQAVSQTGSQQWNFSVPANIPLARRNDGQLYYTGLDLENKRFSRAGTAYLIQVTTPVNFNGEAATGNLNAGSLFIDWECYFETAQINPDAVQLRLDPPDVPICPPIEPIDKFVKTYIVSMSRTSQPLFSVVSDSKVTCHVSNIRNMHSLFSSLKTTDFTYNLRSGSGPIVILSYFCSGTDTSYLSEIEVPAFDLVNGTIYSSDNVQTDFVSATVTLRFSSQEDFVLNKLARSDPAPPTPLVPTPGFLSSVENLAIRDAAFKPNFHDKLDDTLDSADASTFQIGILNTIKDRKFLGANPDCLFCETCCPQDFD